MRVNPATDYLHEKRERRARIAELERRDAIRKDYQVRAVRILRRAFRHDGE